MSNYGLLKGLGRGIQGAGQIYGKYAAEDRATQAKADALAESRDFGEKQYQDRLAEERKYQGGLLDKKNTRADEAIGRSEDVPILKDDKGNVYSQSDLNKIKEETGKLPGNLYKIGTPGSPSGASDKTMLNLKRVEDMEIGKLSAFVKGDDDFVFEKVYKKKKGKMPSKALVDSFNQTRKSQGLPPIYLVDGEENRNIFVPGKTKTWKITQVPPVDKPDEEQSMPDTTGVKLPGEEPVPTEPVSSPAVANNNDMKKQKLSKFSGDRNLGVKKPGYNRPHPESITAWEKKKAERAKQKSPQGLLRNRNLDSVR